MKVGEDKLIIGYSYIDKYKYGRENNTWKKIAITFYYKEE